MSARSEAKAVGATRYFTGKPCPAGHVAERLVSSGACVACVKNYKATTKEQRWESEKKRRERPEVQEARRRAGRAYWDRKSPDERQAYAQASADRVKRWHSEHPERIRTIAAKYRASEKGTETKRMRYLRMTSQVPAWADQAVMDSLYAEAVQISADTGVPHVVDHILPICSDVVSGLHVENNLQILTAVDNIRKGNRVFL